MVLLGYYVTIRVLLVSLSVFVPLRSVSERPGSCAQYFHAHGE